MARGGGATPIQVRSRLVKKEERVRVNGARVSDKKISVILKVFGQPLTSEVRCVTRTLLKCSFAVNELLSKIEPQKN